MADPFATPDDVAARWRPLTEAEEQIAGTLAGDASMRIRARFPGIDDQVASGAVDPGVLTIVVAGMVRRAMLGGSDGVSQETRSIGQASIGVTYVNPLGNVFLTPDDELLIVGYLPRASSHRFANTTNQCGPLGGFVYETGP